MQYRLRFARSLGGPFSQELTSPTPFPSVGIGDHVFTGQTLQKVEHIVHEFVSGGNHRLTIVATKNTSISGAGFQGDDNPVPWPWLSEFFD